MSQSPLTALNPPSNHAAGYTRLLFAASFIMLAGLLWSGWRPFDRATWVMEVVPVMVVLPLLWATQRSYPLTTLLLVLVTLHALVLILGGAYTYARVPLGFAMQEWWQLSRNPYDKATFSRALCRRSRRARSCCAARIYRAARCSPSLWCAWCWRSAPATS
jgi:uncharacterized membrane protein YjdF